MINRDIRRKLPGHFDDVKAWLNVLHQVIDRCLSTFRHSNELLFLQYYPGSDTMKRFLGDLIEFMNNHTTVTAKEFQNYVNTTSVMFA
jgi:hypothetical protein